MQSCPSEDLQIPFAERVRLERPNRPTDGYLSFTEQREPPERPVRCLDVNSSSWITLKKQKLLMFCYYFHQSFDYNASIEL